MPIFQIKPAKPSTARPGLPTTCHPSRLSLLHAHNPFPPTTPPRLCPPHSPPALSICRVAPRRRQLSLSLALPPPPIPHPLPHLRNLPVLFCCTAPHLHLHKPQTPTSTSLSHLEYPHPTIAEQIPRARDDVVAGLRLSSHPLATATSPHSHTSSISVRHLRPGHPRTLHAVSRWLTSVLPRRKPLRARAPPRSMKGKSRSVIWRVGGRISREATRSRRRLKVSSV